MYFALKISLLSSFYEKKFLSDEVSCYARINSAEEGAKGGCGARDFSQGQLFSAGDSKSQ